MLYAYNDCRLAMPPLLRNLSPTWGALPAVAAVALLALFNTTVATNTANDNVTPTPTPSPAPNGFRAVYGSGASKTWDQAQKQCQDWGGNLVKADITDDSVKKRMKKIKCSDVLWVGAHESPKAPGINKDSWQWISDGSSVSTTAWSKDEPNDSAERDEECGSIGLTPRSWFQINGLELADVECENKFYFACEIPRLENDEVGELVEGEYFKVSDCKSLKAHKACLKNPGCDSRCNEMCKEYDVCGCFGAECWEGNVDPKCQKVEKWDRYDGQAEGFSCGGGDISISELPAGHQYCSSSSALSATVRLAGTITLLLVAVFEILPGH